MAKHFGPGETARRLKIGLPRVYVLLWSGKLRASKKDNRWLIPESAIAERLRQIGRTPSAEAEAK